MRAPTFAGLFFGRAMPVAVVMAASACEPAPSSPRVSSGAAGARSADADAPLDFVRASGDMLTAGDAPFVLRGMNVYNANSRGACWSDLADGPQLEASFAALSPSANTVRAWFFQDMAQTRGTDAKGPAARDFRAFDHTFALARRYHLRVVATLENEWADCTSAGEKDEDWYRQGYRHPRGEQLAGYRDWVEEFVARYREEPDLLAIQLMNEASVPRAAIVSDASRASSASAMPAAPCSDDAARVLSTWAADMVVAVKQEAGDTRHLLSVGTVGGAPASCGLRGAEWRDLHALPGVDLCEYHDYDPSLALPAVVKVHIDECHALGKPVFAGELGVADDDPRREATADAKLRAQLGAGAAGVILWKWAPAGKRAADGDASYNIVPGDPLLALLASAGR